MRVSLSSLAAVLLMLAYGTYAGAQANTANAFTTNFSLGSRGARVIALQQILNLEPDTRVARTGPGSPGNETDYFGLLTKAAVVRFQEKYASDVLSPAGLARGNGYVGFYTRAKLNALPALIAGAGTAIPPSAPPPSVAASSTAVTVTPSTSPASTTASQNPNLKNLDKFLAALDRVSARQGFPAADLALVKEQIIKDVATTTDLRATFLRIVQDKSNQAIRNNSPAGGVLAAIAQALGGIFSAERARAATGAPFGGALLFPYYCNCSDTWLLTLGPLPPTFAAILTYVPESQIYLSYNIPLTEWLLGEYTPEAGVCSVYVLVGCAGIPSDGMITPTVGSSLE